MNYTLRKQGSLRAFWMVNCSIYALLWVLFLWQTLLFKATLQVNPIQETDTVMQTSCYTTNQKLQVRCRRTQSHKQAKCYLPTNTLSSETAGFYMQSWAFQPCVFMAKCQTGLITLQGRYSTSKLLCVSNAARVTRPE